MVVVNGINVWIDRDTQVLLDVTLVSSLFRVCCLLITPQDVRDYFPEDLELWRGNSDLRDRFHAAWLNAQSREHNPGNLEGNWKDCV